MNKITISGILLLVIAIVTVLIIISRRSPFGKKNSSFVSEPKSEITKIEFSDNDKTIYLEKEGDKWLLNGRLETRKSSLFYIERILVEMKIKSPVSEELFEKEVLEKGNHPVRVRVFEKRKLLNSFLVFKTTSNNYGNIMKKRESTKPYIVYIPDYEGNIGSIFTLNELYWQPYTIFNLLPSEIASIHFENLSDTSNSFMITNSNHKFTISNSEQELTGWDTTLVSRYLSYFTRVPFEEWALDMGEEEKVEIGSRKPLYRITVVTANGIETNLQLWERIAAETLQKDSDRLWGKTEKDNEFFVIRYFDIDPLIKKRSYFFPK